MVAHRTLTTLAIMMPSASKCFQSKLSIMFNAIKKNLLISGRTISPDVQCPHKTKTKHIHARENGNSCWEVEDDGLDHDHDTEGHTLFRVPSR